MTPKPYDLVVFDLGGVLIRIVRSWAEGHERAGLPGAPPDDPEFELERRELSRRQTRGDLASAEYCRLVAQLSGGGYGPAAVAAIHEAWLIEEYPGVGAVVEAVHASGLETAVLSNTSELQWDRVLHTESEAERFATVRSVGRHFASHQLRAAKPDRAAFDAVTHATGYVGRRILFFDDREANVDASRDANWAGVLVDPAGDTAKQMLFALKTRMVTP